MLAHLFVRRRREFVVRILVVEVPVEARLESETVHNCELTPHDDTRRLQFGRLKPEPAGVVAELRRLLGQELGDDAHFEVLLRVEGLLGTVDEDVLLSRVAVHVNESEDVFIQGCRLALLGLLRLFVGAEKQVARELLDGGDGWVDAEVRLDVPAIHIVAAHARTVVANNDTVCVDHRDDLEDHSLPKLLRLMGVTKQVLDEALHHVGAI